MTRDNPPVLLLGGSENAVSCARRFTAAGITTVVVNDESAPAMRSRNVVPVPLGERLEIATLSSWLTEHVGVWAGAVLIPLSDRALTAVVDGYEGFKAAYRPALLDPSVVAAMLDKQTTLELAGEAGVPAPRQWIPGQDGVDSLLTELVYPVILKPRHGYELVKLTGAKYLRADSESDLMRQVPVAEQLPSGYVLNEFIVGDDSQLSSYYGIRSADGDTLLEFTKRVDRRCPPNKGGATFHELADLPATAELGRRFFDHVGVVGLANVEFKADARTGELKIIECNHRITAAVALMQDNGIDLAGAVYDQALGRPVGPIPDDASGHLWYPVRDLISHRLSGDSVRGWLKRPAHRPSYPYWSWSDPAPALGMWRRAVTQWVGKRRDSVQPVDVASQSPNTAANGSKG